MFDSQVSRRSFIATTAALLGTPLISYVRAADAIIIGDRSRKMVLSQHGCGRATAYAESNKIVTVGNRTHVAWLDSVNNRFLARIRTFDHANTEWSPIYTLGEAQDNHGGPALTVDSQGYLHVVYYPHHAPFRYQRSQCPNDASAWTAPEDVGTLCTYPCMLCDAEDNLLLIARESRGDREIEGQEPWNMTWHVNLYRKPKNGTWSEPTPIIQAQHVGYSHYQAELTWGPDHRTLHLTTRIREKQGKWEETIGYMASDDGGQTWRRSDGSRIEHPATAKTIDIIEQGGQLTEARGVLLGGGITVDNHGTPHVFYTRMQPGGISEGYVATPDGQGGWDRTPLSPSLPDSLAGCNITLGGGITHTDHGALIAVATTYEGNKRSESWAGNSNEIVCFISRDAGRTFTGHRLSALDPTTPHWLPNIERPTGYNMVSEHPGLIYTAGPAGKGSHDILSNQVVWRSCPNSKK